MVTRKRRVTAPPEPQRQFTLPAVVLQPGDVILVEGRNEIVTKRTRVDNGPRWEIQTDQNTHVWGAARAISVISTESASITRGT